MGAARAGRGGRWAAGTGKAAAAGVGQGGESLGRLLGPVDWVLYTGQWATAGIGHEEPLGTRKSRAFDGPVSATYRTKH